MCLARFSRAGPGAALLDFQNRRVASACHITALRPVAPPTPPPRPVLIAPPPPHPPLSAPLTANQTVPGPAAFTLERQEIEDLLPAPLLELPLQPSRCTGPPILAIGSRLASLLSVKTAAAKKDCAYCPHR